MVILLGSMNQTFINKIKSDRYFDHLKAPTGYNSSLYYRVFVRSDHWRYGDLYGVSFLHDYKFPLEPFKEYNRDGRKPLTGRILYIIGDSYLADKTLSGAFDGFDNVVYLDRRFPFGPITLDSTRQNYLIMEFAERNLNDYALGKTAEKRWAAKDIAAKLNFNPTTANSAADAYLPTSIPERINKVIFNKDLSRNLELLLFDDKLFTPIKELKAAINYKLFGRVAKEVAVSTDKKRLLMNITVDTSNRESDFRNVNDGELKKLIGNLDDANKYYLSIGFKKVILSVVPNAVSVYDDKRMPYNHLLERVEQNNRFPVISIFNKFKTAPDNIYYRSDTHWNPTGLDTWIKEVNKNINTW
ncbi:hypothetical protein [Mucilaginibacter sp.]|uniref:hypothetical protein n=1 Tax=Mucilaginibacter sp. TaxID=1882438 RepID=UPI003D0ADB93